MIVENPILSHHLVLVSHVVLYEVIDVTLTTYHCDDTYCLYATEL